MSNKISKNKYIKCGGLPTEQGDIPLKYNEIYYTPIIIDNLTQFNSCKFIGGIIISSEISTLIDELFVDCIIVGNIDIPSNIVSIGRSSFFRYHGILSNLILHDGLVDIGPKAFYNSSIRNINIPRTVRNIGNEAFSRCNELIEVKFDIYIQLYAINSKLFYECYQLKYVNIPMSVNVIRSYAFSKCINLTFTPKNFLYLDRNIQEVEHNAFEHCQSITELIIEQKDEIILGDRAFYGCLGIDDNTTPGFLTSFFKGFHSGIDTYLFHPPQTNNGFYKKSIMDNNVDITGVWKDDKTEDIVFYNSKRLSNIYFGKLNSQNEYHGLGILLKISRYDYNYFNGTFRNGSIDKGCMIYKYSDDYDNRLLIGIFNIHNQNDFKGIYIKITNSKRTVYYNVYIPTIYENISNFLYGNMTVFSIKTFTGTKINDDGSSIPYNFIDNCEYIGEINEIAQRNGYGTHLINDNEKVTGYWINNIIDIDRDAEYIYPNKNKYLGRLVQENNEGVIKFYRHGKGKLMDAENNQVLTGFFHEKDNIFCGMIEKDKNPPKNVIIERNIIVYEGETNELCQRHGHGTKLNTIREIQYIRGYWIDDILDQSKDVEILYSNGGHYIGKIVNYAPTGKGIFTNPSNSLILDGIFSGNIKNFCGLYKLGKTEPMNVIMSDNKIVYEGETNELCQRHGHGTNFNNIREIQHIKGYWIKDALNRSKDVELLYKDRSHYIGKIVNYAPTGKGIFTNPSNSLILNGIFMGSITFFCGSYQLGKEEPKNVIMSDDDIIYEGETNETCQKHGVGTEFFYIGNFRHYKISGQWVNNILMLDQDVTITYVNGDLYIGKVMLSADRKTYLYNGKGKKIILSENLVLTGLFLDNGLKFCGSYQIEEEPSKNGIFVNNILKYEGETNELCQKHGIGTEFINIHTSSEYRVTGEWRNDKLIADNDYRITQQDGNFYVGKVSQISHNYYPMGKGVENIRNYILDGMFIFKSIQRQYFCGSFRNSLKPIQKELMDVDDSEIWQNIKDITYAKNIIINRINSEISYIGETNEQCQRHGIGKYFYINDLSEINVYESYIYGEWINNELVIAKDVKLISSNGNKYIGRVNPYRGWWIPHGKGTEIKNGITYSGNFINNVLSYGSVTYPDKSIYTGNLLNLEKHGAGEYRLPNGDIYNGEFRNDQYHGPGELRCKNGDIYDGQFINGQLNGKGTFQEHNGSVYIGNWLNGERHGLGDQVDVIDNTPLVINFVDKISTLRDEYRNCDEIINMPLYPKITQTYRGNWENNLRHGIGTLYDANNAIIHRPYWMNDEPFDLETLKLRHNRKIDAETVRRESGGIMIVPLTENIPGTQIPYIDLARVIKMNFDKLPKNFFELDHNIHKFPVLFNNLAETIRILKIVNHTPHLDVLQRVNQNQSCELVIELKELLSIALEQSTDREFNSIYNGHVPNIDLRSEIKSQRVLQFRQDRKGLCVYLIIYHMLNEIYDSPGDNFMNLNRGGITCYHILLLVINFLKLQTNEFRIYWAELYIANVVNSYGINVSAVRINTHISCTNGIAERSLFFIISGLIQGDINDQLTESRDIEFPKAMSYREYQEKRKDIRNDLLARFHQAFQLLVNQDNLDSECAANKLEEICKQNNKCIWKPSEWNKCQSLNCNLSNILSYFEIQIRMLPIDYIPSQWLSDIWNYINTSLLEYAGGGKYKKLLNKSSNKRSRTKQSRNKRSRTKQSRNKQSRNKQSRKK